MATIRPATDADVPALVALGQRFLAWSPYASLAVTDEALASAIRRVMATGFAMVADDAGDPFGALLGVLSSPWVDDSKRIAVELAWWVEPEHRGSTAAVRLLREFQAWAKANGADGVTLSDLVVNGDAPAGELFNRLGFRMTERSHYCEVEATV